MSYEQLKTTIKTYLFLQTATITMWWVLFKDRRDLKKKENVELGLNLSDNFYFLDLLIVTTFAPHSEGDGLDPYIGAMNFDMVFSAKIFIFTCGNNGVNSSCGKNEPKSNKTILLIT